MQIRRLRFVSRVTLGLAGLLLTPMMAHAVQVTAGPTLTMDPNGATPLAGGLLALVPVGQVSE